MRSPPEWRVLMIELLRTNDIVLISRIEALMAEHEIDLLVADQHMSVLEGSTGFLQRRMMIGREDLHRARMALHEAGLLDQLGPTRA
jgi:hypothetical protein